MGLRILVTGAGGDSAQGVIRALRKAPHDYVIASICIGKHSPGLYMSDIREIAPPIALEAEYIEFLIGFIHRHAIDILIPTIDGELPLVCKFRSEIERRSKVKVIIGSEQAVSICSDKLAASAYLASVDVDQPETMSIEDAARMSEMISAGAKLITKPRMGGGSKGIRILGANDLENDDWLNGSNIYQRFDDYSKEFTAVVMKDGEGIAAIVVLERILGGGRTIWCKRVSAEPYEKMLREVADGLDIPYLNIQFGLVNGIPHVFDLNPRFSGSTGVFSEVFNGPHLLAQKYFSGAMPTFICADKYFESVRYYEDMIVDCHAN